jgi:hypothetical protein
MNALFSTSPHEDFLRRDLLRAFSEPQDADLVSLYGSFELYAPISISEQLAKAGHFFDQIAALIAIRADLAISSWQQRHSPIEPVVLPDFLEDLFVQSQQVDLSDLFFEDSQHYYPQRESREGSFAQPVEKPQLLTWIDEVELVTENESSVITAEDENPSEWIEEVMRYWENHSQTVIPWLNFCEEIPLAQSALFTGLLLGEFLFFRVEETEFYNPCGVRVTKANYLQQN